MAGTNDILSGLASGERDNLHALVHRFEDVWQGGRRPAIDDFLPPGPCGRLPVLVELVHVELEYRLKAGEPAGVADYLERYPELKAHPAVVAGLAAAELELRRRDPGLPLELLAVHLDRIGGRFEAALKAAGGGDPQPIIEDYLADVPEVERAALLPELIALEVAYRRSWGENPRTEDYRERFLDDRFTSPSPVLRQPRSS
jgi:hypothetical protein